MSYPNIIYGDYGDEKITKSTAIGGLPLGQLMILPDGRKFRHAQCGSAASIDNGLILAASAGLAGHGAVASSGIAATAATARNKSGDTTVYLTCNSAVSVLLNYYADGFLNVQKSAGNGYMYRVKENTSCASASAFSVTLYPDDPLKVAFAATSTKVSLRRSPYKEAILASVSAAIGPVMGVSPTPVTASYYFWVQRSGPASVRTAATAVVVGAPVVTQPVESGSAAPAVSGGASTQIWDSYFLGLAMEAPDATDAALVNLTLE